MTNLGGKLAHRLFSGLGAMISKCCFGKAIRRCIAFGVPASNGEGGSFESVDETFQLIAIEMSK